MKMPSFQYISMINIIFLMGASSPGEISGLAKNPEHECPLEQRRGVGMDQD